ncbi:MAG: peptidoglycan DD-metalloendopeptidase family protein [Bacteroidales bacterium]|nr:peptidoglycan DD-metalloendopeptidase family protein [Bacteroidales bacterium]MCF8403132.1 peptidoglycan DD-metalloendopeptidase family protein [Bacteroidales bacterium]
MRKTVLYLCLLTGLTFNLVAQENISIKHLGDSYVWEKGATIGYPARHAFKSQSLISERMRTEVKVFAKNYFKSHLRKEEHPYFSLPVQQADGLNDPGFYSISAYFDHDSLYPGHLLDFECGSLTYDTEEGYNHGGTDFFPWPFPWKKMIDEEIEIVAAADGILVFKQDGYNDMHCEGENEPWNGLAILHSDGSTTWYIHMKKNSLTGVAAGLPVSRGDYLGMVGSSGISFSPHLHFEVYNPEEVLIDPFYGPCNQQIEETWWLNQPGYKEAGVNKISTNNHLPVFSDCLDAEILNETINFYPGDSIYFLNYFRNMPQGENFNISIKRPDNSVFDEWLWVYPQEFIEASWWYFFTILINEPFGEWKYNVTYKNQTFTHVFKLLDPQAINETNVNPVLIFPNPCSDILNIQNDVLDISSIKLYSPLGNCVFSQPLQCLPQSQYSFKLPDMPGGLYYLEIDSNKGTFREKILKQ